MGFLMLPHTVLQVSVCFGMICVVKRWVSNQSLWQPLVPVNFTAVISREKSIEHILAHWRYWTLFLLWIIKFFVKCIFLGKICVFKGVYLTATGFALLVAVDEEVAGALRAEWQQGTLQHSWQQSKAQQEGPQGGIPHDGFNTKDLQNTRNTLLTHDRYNTVLFNEHHMC